jgi:hypothetical protein
VESKGGPGAQRTDGVSDGAPVDEIRRGERVDGSGGGAPADGVADDVAGGGGGAPAGDVGGDGTEGPVNRDPAEAEFGFEDG